MLASTLKNPNEHAQDFLFVFVLFFKMTSVVFFFFVCESSQFSRINQQKGRLANISGL